MTEENSDLFAARQKLDRAVDCYDWEILPAALSQLLQAAAIQRPEFVEIAAGLPSEVAGGEPLERAERAMRQSELLVRSLIYNHGRGTELTWAPDDSLDLPARAQNLVTKLTECLGLGIGVRQLPVAVFKDAIRVGKFTTISFHRTLRIPEDGRDYPLPAGFGAFPIFRVEDFAAKVPAHWLEEGGFFIPLYQAEALFIAFQGEKSHPSIAKVAVGNVNAITGKEHDLRIRSEIQDYVVIPHQKYLDGINAGPGRVRQFVAMPLGDGYTVEAQISGEEKVGGLQLLVFEPIPGRFPDRSPQSEKEAQDRRVERAREEVRNTVLQRLTPDEALLLLEMTRSRSVEASAKRMGASKESLFAIIHKASAQVKMVSSSVQFADCFGTIYESSPPSERDVTPRFQPAEGQFMPAARTRVEMGIAAGGAIKQQIFQDTFGASTWDVSARRCLTLRIVNSQAFTQITGLPAPSSPITRAEYDKQRIPWYSAYDEKARVVGAAGAFRRLLSIGQINQKRNIVEKEQPAIEPLPIATSQIMRIHLPTAEERLKELSAACEESLNAGLYAKAISDASYAIELSAKPAWLHYARAFAHYRLGHDSDAEADASKALEMNPDNLHAKVIRAYSLISLGEPVLAKKDVDEIVATKPDHWYARLLGAQASLNAGDFKRAIAEAENLVSHAETKQEAERILASAKQRLASVAN